MESNATVTLDIARTDPASRHRFEAPVRSAHARVLDALHWIRENEDPTLGFRYACRVGMCGACAVVIDGREALACQATLGDVDGGALRVEPLRGLPARHDLIVDMRPFFEDLARAGAALRPREPDRRGLPVLPPGAGDRTAIEARNGCFTCGACVSAVAGEAAGDDGVGPAALNRVLMLALDERDAAGTARLSAIAGEARGLSAETMARAESVCPARIPLSETLERLKALVAGHDDDS